jgi:hypothetical protein
MSAVGPYLVSGLTVLLVISLAAVITSSPEAAVPSGAPALNPSEAGQPSGTADPVSGGGAQVVMPNGRHQPQVRSGPPWAPAPRPPGPI